MVRPRALAVFILRTNSKRMGRSREFHKPVALLSLLQVLPLNSAVLQTSYNLMTRYQLLPADSVDAALIRRHNLPALVTRDDDFDHVENLDVYKP